MDTNPQTEQILKVIKKFKDGGLGIGGYGVLPWLLFLIAIIIIIIYLIKIEMSSNGNKWETNKCSSKYVFFSGYMKNGGNALEQTLNNFNECIVRFL